MSAPRRSYKEIIKHWQTHDSMLVEEAKRTVNTAYLEQKLAFANRRYDLLSRTVMNLLEELAAREDDDLR